MNQRGGRTGSGVLLRRGASTRSFGSRPCSFSLRGRLASIRRKVASVRRKVSVQCKEVKRFGSSTSRRRPKRRARAPLTRARVLEAAVELADREGIDAVSMRRLGQELGIEAMSLYTHVRGKEDLLDGMVDAVVGEIPITARSRLADDAPADDPRRPDGHAPPPMGGARHRDAKRARAGDARYMEAVTGIIRGGGFTVDLTHHAMHVLGSRMLGFNQDLYDERATPTPSGGRLRGPAGRRLPEHRRDRVAASHEGGLGGCDDDYEFAFGLDLILDGLERRRAL